MTKLLFTIALLLTPLISAEEKVADYARINFKNWAFHCENIVDICIYRQDWSPPTQKFPKGHSKLYAVVIGVHKGSLKVGEKITYNRYVEFGRQEIQQIATEKPKSSKIVEGRLAFAIFANEDYEKSNGVYNLIGDVGHIFNFGDEFHKALLSRKKVDPKLKGDLDDQ